MMEETIEHQPQKNKAINKLYDKMGGDEIIQIGIYGSPPEDMIAAHENAILRMVRLLPPLKKKHRVLILGSGNGNTARYLAEKYGCKVDAVNPYKLQNQKNEALTEAAELADKITIHKGDFRHLPFERETFELVLSQDDLSQSNKKNKIFGEVKRVLQTSGRFIFTGYMSQENISKEELLPLSEKMQIKELSSTRMYKKLVDKVGLESVYQKGFPVSLKMHATNILSQLNDLDKKTVKEIGKIVVTKEIEKWELRLEAQEKGLLSWGIFQFQKMNE